MLNPGAAGAGKRKDSGDSLNFRDTGKNESFINPIVVYRQSRSDSTTEALFINLEMLNYQSERLRSLQKYALEYLSQGKQFKGAHQLEASGHLKSLHHRKQCNKIIRSICWIKPCGFDNFSGQSYSFGPKGATNPIAVDGFGDSGGFDPSHRDAANAFLDDEEKEAEEARRFQDEKKRQNESPYKEFYRDTTGNFYDPAKKFGIIQDNSLLYDNVTTSYPLNLPTDYYLKYIQSTLPQKDAATKWFIRPHHLETLTSHQQSVKDDVLNTRYYSHYNQQHGKKEERNEAEEAIKMIEGHLGRLRQLNFDTAMQRGIPVDQIENAIEEQRHQIQRQAQEEFEKIISDKNRMDSKGLIIEAYESVLLERRRLEKELLNSKRFKEFEKNRPPQDKWYELKSAEFTKELYRNRMALKPNDENRVYLQTLQDKNLY